MKEGLSDSEVEKISKILEKLEREVNGCAGVFNYDENFIDVELVFDSEGEQRVENYTIDRKTLTLKG